MFNMPWIFRGSAILNLKVGVVVLVVSGLLFAMIAVNVMSGNALTLADAQVAEWLHTHSTPVLTQSLLVLTHLHDPITISFMVVLIALYMIWKKRWYAVAAIIFVVPGGMLLNLLLKDLFHRARPTFEDPLVLLTTYSFPSGHVVATTVFYGVLAALSISQNSSSARSAFILSFAFAMVILVAFSRVYLGAHFLSDVLAAFLEGIAWLAFCLIAIRIYRIYHKQ